MRGILALLFLCVTLHLAEGTSYRSTRDKDLYQESEPRVDRKNFKSPLERDDSDGKKGTMTILGKALLETAITLLYEPPEKQSEAAEDRRPAEESGGRFRDFSVSSDLGASFLQPLNINLGFRRDSSSWSDGKENKHCFIRQVLDALNAHVLSAYNKYIRKRGYPPRGPKMLTSLVEELSEHLDTVPKIEDLDDVVLKYVKVLLSFCRTLRLNFRNRCCENVEKKHLLGLIAKVRLLLQDFTEMSEEAADSKAPSTSLLLNILKNVLLRLSGEDSIEKKHLAYHSNAMKLFIQDAHIILQALIKEIFNLRDDYATKSFNLKEILLDLDKTLKELLEKDTFFEKGSQSDEFFQKIITGIEEIVANTLTKFS